MAAISPVTQGKLALLSAELRPRLTALMTESPTVITITSGYRSYAEQERLHKLFLAGKGAPANRPGRSKHEWTVGANKTPAAGAADLGWSSAAVRDGANGRPWAHKNAARFGLHFPIKGEPWHIESNGKPFVAQKPVAVPPTAVTAPAPITPAQEVSKVYSIFTLDGIDWGTDGIVRRPFAGPTGQDDKGAWIRLITRLGGKVDRKVVSRAEAELLPVVRP